MADQTKQEEAHAAAVREKALRDRTLSAIQSWPTDADGNPMAVFVGMASDLVPTVPFGNVTIQATIMRPVPIGQPIDEGELTQDIENARAVQKAAGYVVGTERRLLQWALDPASRIVNPTTGAEFTGAGETPGQPPAGPAAVESPVAPSGVPPTPQPGTVAPVAGAPGVSGDSGAQVG